MACDGGIECGGVGGKQAGADFITNERNPLVGAIWGALECGFDGRMKNGEVPRDNTRC